MLFEVGSGCCLLQKSPKCNRWLENGCRCRFGGLDRLEGAAEVAGRVEDSTG